jgi:hypothetical protein
LLLTLSGQMQLDDGHLAAVTYIDSSGVGMMAGALQQVRTRGGFIRLLHLNSRTQRLFGTMKLLIAFEPLTTRQRRATHFLTAKRHEFGRHGWLARTLTGQAYGRPCDLSIDR